jgi:hypothetical protein
MSSAFASASYSSSTEELTVGEVFPIAGGERVAWNMKTAAHAKVALLVVLLSLSARAVFAREAKEASSRGGFPNETEVPASLRTFANDTAGPAAEPKTPAAGPKRMFIAPGFGAVLYKVRVDQEGVPNVSSAFLEQEYYTTALETRVFWGINITKRAGLYTGVEAGGTIFLPRTETHTDTGVTVNDQNSVPVYTTPPLTIVFNTSINGGSVFLLWKYGYRYEFAFRRSALSVGLQLGTGLSMFSGGYDLWVGDKDNPDAEMSWSTQSARLSIATEFAFETAFRIGENFRLFAAAGLLVTPISFEDRDKTYLKGSEVMQDGVQNPDADYIPYALNAYRVEVDGFGFSVRAGASFNF